MNGRIYDPTLGRFLQADPIIQAPKNSQNYNRYSYVLNNPLKYTDPTGYSFWSRLWKKVVRPFIGLIAMAIPVVREWALATGWNAFLFGFGTGAVSSGTLKGALIGGFSALAFQQIGKHFSNLSDTNQLYNRLSLSEFRMNLTEFGGNMLTSGQIAGQIAAHAVTGGVISTLSGGKFGHGFFAAGFTKGVGTGLNTGFNNGPVSGTIVAIAVGGTASVISGGKFANGARTAAYQSLFNSFSDWFRRKNYSTPSRGNRPRQTARGLMAEQAGAESIIDYETTTHAEAKYVYGIGAVLAAPVSIPASVGLGLLGAGHSYYDTMNTSDGSYNNNAFTGEGVGAFAVGIEHFDSSLTPLGQTIGRVNLGYQVFELTSKYNSTCFSPYRCN